MTKHYFIPFFFCCLFAAVTAFSQARETTVKFRDARHPAFSNEYNFPPDIVSEAILQRLKHDGLSASSRRGIISSRGVHYNVLTPDAVDLYFLVKGKGRKGRDGSEVDLLVSRGRDNFIGGSDPELARNALQYLDDLRHDIAVYGLQQQIKQQKKSVDNKARDYKKLLKSAHKLESKRYDLQRDMSGETDSDKRDKIRKKLDKLERDIHKKQAGLRDCQRDLQDQKDQLSLLKDRLDRENER